MTEGSSFVQATKKLDGRHGLRNKATTSLHFVCQMATLATLALVANSFTTSKHPPPPLHEYTCWTAGGEDEEVKVSSHL